MLVGISRRASLMSMCVQGRVIESVQCGLMGFSFVHEIPASLRVVLYYTCGASRAVAWSAQPLSGQATPGSPHSGHQAIASLTHIACNEHGKRGRRRRQHTTSRPCLAMPPDSIVQGPWGLCHG